MEGIIQWIANQTGLPSQYVIPGIVGVLVFVVLFFFVFRFLVPSLVIFCRLKKLAGRIKGVQVKPAEQRRQAVLDAFRTVDWRFGKKYAETMKAVWGEYAETLHDQKAVRDGVSVVVKTRATAQADLFFTPQRLIDTPIRSEFYKHVPGILTGIGIVGTFAGLMRGLDAFDPSTPELVTASVAVLLQDVFYAFVGSGGSITASVFVTVLEKSCRVACERQLEELTTAINALFDAGLGEEYLSALVKSSEDSSVQMTQLKDSIVSDLQRMVSSLEQAQRQETQNMTAALAKTYAEAGQQMAQQISGAMQESLRAPMDKIAGAVQVVSGEQGHQVQGILQDVLVAFMKKLDETLGQQFNGLSETLQQSVAAMQQMQTNVSQLVQGIEQASEKSARTSTQAMTQLIEDMAAGQSLMQENLQTMLQKIEASVESIGQAGQGAGEQMTEQMKRLFEESERRQSDMAQTMQSFVTSLNEQVEQGQTQNASQMQASVDALSEKLSAVFDRVETNRTALDEKSQLAQQQLQQTTQDFVTSLSEPVSALVDGIAAQQTQLQQTMEQLHEQTQSSLRDMCSGAEKMTEAAARFTEAGQSVGSAGRQVMTVAQTMNQSGYALQTATSELTKVVSDYRATRDATQHIAELLGDYTRVTQGDVQERKQYLADLTALVAQMRQINDQEKQFLGQVGDVLAKSFTDFTQNMTESVYQTTTKMDNSLSKACTTLASTVNSIEEAVGDFNDTLEEVRRERRG